MCIRDRVIGHHTEGNGNVVLKLRQPRDYNDYDYLQEKLEEDFGFEDFQSLFDTLTIMRMNENYFYLNKTYDGLTIEAITEPVKPQSVAHYFWRLEIQQPNLEEFYICSHQTKVTGNLRIFLAKCQPAGLILVRAMWSREENMVFEVEGLQQGIYILLFERELTDLNYKDISLRISFNSSDKLEMKEEDTQQFSMNTILTNCFLSLVTAPPPNDVKVSRRDYAALNDDNINEYIGVYCGYRFLIWINKSEKKGRLKGKLLIKDAAKFDFIPHPGSCVKVDVPPGQEQVALLRIKDPANNKLHYSWTDLRIELDWGGKIDPYDQISLQNRFFDPIFEYIDYTAPLPEAFTLDVRKSLLRSNLFVERGIIYPNGNSKGAQIYVYQQNSEEGYIILYENKSDKWLIEEHIHFYKLENLRLLTKSKKKAQRKSLAGTPDDKPQDRTVVFVEVPPRSFKLIVLETIVKGVGYSYNHRNYYRLFDKGK
eukprot:TRINITY_DN17786_c0_g2_i2.p1 TRINITY_DN17786_c0_g2~~TRINITY_DN17786_c0_g2_i2.p1  ORF type:complete len:482 (+),score=72.63 TRINITY_DN17786_c0_g2_i2:64-1509(+)